jgi:putative transposase
VPRRARLAIAGIHWHIIQRGHNRCACFFHEEDYRFYLEQLSTQAQKIGCLVHAYCLMTNHVHSLVTPQEKDSASLLMKNLGQRYVQFINRTHQRTGTLWDGRFKSCLTQEERCVLVCYRYIELNPVRAGMVPILVTIRGPEGFNGAGDPNALITPHLQYLGLSANSEERLNNYEGLIVEKFDENELSAIRGAKNGNYVLGNTLFQKEIEIALGRRTRPGRPGRPTPM